MLYSLAPVSKSVNQALQAHIANHAIGSMVFSLYHFEVVRTPAAMPWP